MKKLINFKCSETVKSIQSYANSNFDGNFTLAVINLCKKSLKNVEAKKQ